MSTDIANSEAVVFPEEPPQLWKLGVQLYDDQGKLGVMLHVALDPKIPDEKAAADAFSGDSNEPVLEIQHHPDLDLKAERKVLSDRIAAAYRTTAAGQVMRAKTLSPINLDDLRDAFMPVAEQGSSVWWHLFSPSEEALEGYSPGDRKIALAALRSAMQREHRVVVESDVSQFPWAFLYDGEGLSADKLSTLDFTRFWGFRHEIQEEIAGHAKRFKLPASPKLVAAVSKSEDPQGEHTQSALGKAANVEWIPSADALKNKLASFDGDCFYFYGHALHADPPTPTTSALRMEGFNVTVFDVEKKGGPAFTKDLVFVFLNGCETTPLNDWNPSSFVGLFCKKGGNKVCCVGTFAEVPEVFGRAFAARFWEHFLAKKEPLGASLLRARREMMHDYNHPMGLLYGLFGKIETQIAP